MDSEKKGLQVPTGSNMASLNAKLLGAQRPRYLMNLIGCWHSEDQVRVGEYERRGVGSVGGLQPMVTEAFLQEGDNIQCEL